MRINRTRTDVAMTAIVISFVEPSYYYYYYY